MTSLEIEKILFNKLSDEQEAGYYRFEETINNKQIVEKALKYTGIRSPYNYDDIIKLWCFINEEDYDYYKIPKNTKVCKFCADVKDCKVLCQDMKNILTCKKIKNKKKIRKANSDFCLEPREVFTDLFSTVDKIFYLYGLDERQSNLTKKVIVAMLDPKDIEIMKMLADGVKQVDIAERMNVSQPSIAQRIKSIKRDISKQLVEILPDIIDKA